MGAYQAAVDRGWRIPDDVSIVGFDNQENIADGLRPGLTTLALPHYEMGQWAVQTLSTLSILAASTLPSGSDAAVSAGAPRIGGLAARPVEAGTANCHHPSSPVAAGDTSPESPDINELEDSVVSHTLKRLAAVSVAAALALSLAACGKGGSSSSEGTDSSGTATLKLWTHSAGNETELAQPQPGRHGLTTPASRSTRSRCRPSRRIPTTHR